MWGKTKSCLQSSANKAVNRTDVCFHYHRTEKNLSMPWFSISDMSWRQKINVHAAGVQHEEAERKRAEGTRQQVPVFPAKIPNFADFNGFRISHNITTTSELWLIRNIWRCCVRYPAFRQSFSFFKIQIWTFLIFHTASWSQWWGELIHSSWRNKLTHSHDNSEHCLCLSIFPPESYPPTSSSGNPPSTHPWPCSDSWPLTDEFYHFSDSIGMDNWYWCMAL